MTLTEVECEIRVVVGEFGDFSSRTHVTLQSGGKPRMIMHPGSVTDFRRDYRAVMDWSQCIFEIVLSERDLEDDYVARHVRMHEAGHVLGFLAAQHSPEILDEILVFMNDPLRSAKAKFLDMKMRNRRFSGKSAIRPKRGGELYPPDNIYTYQDMELFAVWFSWKMGA